MADLTLLDLTEAKKKAMSDRTLRLTDNIDNWAEVFMGVKTASGKNVTRQTALRVSAVLACVRILMEDVSSLPLILKRKTAQGAEDADNHPLYRLLKISPNSLQTSVEVREHLMMDLMLSGKFFAWQQRNRKGELQAIWPLRASNMNFLASDNTSLGLRVTWRYSAPELTKEFDQFELWRGSIMSQSTIDGNSLVLLAREAIGLAMAAEEQGAKLFSQGIQTNLTLNTDGDLNEEQRNQLKTSLQETYAGSSNAYKVLLLESGLKAEKIGLTAQESQYIESRAYQMADIARVFRVPGVMLGIGDKTSTYASAEQFFLAYVKHTIQPWVVRLEQTISRDLILPSETKLFPKHQLSALLRADQKTRYECYAIGIQNSIIKPAEAREFEDLDTSEEVDHFLQSTTLTVVGQDPAALPAAPNAPGQPPPPSKPQPPPDGKAESIALRVADALVKTEVREFARQRTRNDSALKGQGTLSSNPVGEAFSVWHREKVQTMTGASADAVREYSEWRFDPKGDPLTAENDMRARAWLVKLCLEA